MRSMDPGQMTDRITIRKRFLSGADAEGAPVEVFADLVTVWCRMVPIVGRGDFAADQVQNLAIRRFQIRYREDVDGADRILYEGKEYAIIDIIELGQRDGLSITCNARVP